MGVGRHRPEMDSETRVQALRGAAGAKTAQCRKLRCGNPECMHNVYTVLNGSFVEKKVLGKTGASRRGNTRSTSGGHFYWA
jgi:hypothetical protein